MNDCYLCGWSAPTAAALRDHLITCHPGQKNEPTYIERAAPVIDWEKTGADWQAIADRMRVNYNDLIDNAFVVHYARMMENAQDTIDRVAYETLTKGNQ